MKRHHDHDNSYKQRHLIDLVACTFRGLVHYQHSEEHGDRQTEMVLEKELLYVDTQAAGSRLSVILIEA